MGAPKKHRRKYETPGKPYDRSRLEKERKIRQDFGLRRKREIWRAEGMLRNFRQRARELQARRDEEKEKALFEKINKIGIGCSGLEDVLEITLEKILSRRLQTIVHSRGMANSPRHARQLIVHGHVIVNGRKILWPGYIVEKIEEENIVASPKLAKAAMKQEGEKR